MNVKLGYNFSVLNIVTGKREIFKKGSTIPLIKAKKHHQCTKFLNNKGSVICAFYGYTMTTKIKNERRN